jgi:hypothetical protein
MGKNIGFRGWFYFRQGWSVYFAFIFAAINTLTVTYYLAIEKMPDLQIIFPSFIQYVIIMVSIGIPSLILIGYFHYKKSSAYKSEADIHSESNPYMGRMVVNSEMLIQLNLKLTYLMIKLSNDEKFTKEELEEIKLLQKKLSDYFSKRIFADKKDIDFFNILDKNK